MPILTPVELTSQIWRYGAAPNAVLGNMVFRPDGKIGGYHHPNEAFWRLTEQSLDILDVNGAPSRRFQLDAQSDGRLPGQALSSEHRFWLEPNASHPIMVPYAEDVLQAAKRGRFYLSHLARQEGVYAAGDPIMLHPGSDIEPGATLPAGAFFKIGAFSYVVGQVRNNLSIGRYCSIAAGLSVFGDSHPTSWLSSSPMSYAPHHQRFFADAGVDTPPALQDWEAGNSHVVTRIGHDVWIGGGVLLKPGITIGNGAVIATRSIITKDVPPYAIMGGSPARVLKFRFEQPVIDKLNESAWWDYDLSRVQLDWRDAEAAADTILALTQRGEIGKLFFPSRDYARDILAGRVLAPK